MPRVGGRFLIAVAVLGSMVGMNAYFHALVPDVTAPPPERIPMELGDWQGREVKLSEDQLAQVLAGGRLAAFERVYQDPEGRMVNAITIYLERPEAVHHTPERCLTGGGWSISRVSTTTIPLVGEGEAAEANLVPGAKGDMEIVELFLFVSPDGFRRSALQSMVDYSRRGGSKRDQTMAMIIMTTQIAADADDREAIAYMADFAGRFLPEVHSSMQ